MTARKARRREHDGLLSHNLDAERSVLGALVVHNPNLDLVADVLQPGHFYRDAHQRIYRAALALAAKRTAIDFVTLAEQLARNGELDEVGGPTYVAALADGLPRSTNVAHYAAVVRDHATRRALTEAAMGMLDSALAADTADAAVEAAELALSALAAQASVGDVTLVGVRDLVAAAQDVIDTVQRTGRPVVGVETGLADLDVQTLGMHPGQLVVVAARPGEGKSALALNIARHASRAGTVLFCSLEMDKSEIGERLLTSESRVDGHRLRSAPIPDGHAMWAALGAAVEALGPARLLVDDAPHRTVGQVRRLARRVQATRKDLRLLVIDYLGLLTPETRRKDAARNQELADMTRALKLLAKELRLPILLLAQLNREVEKRKGGRHSRPRLSDLAETGATEKDADQVWFIHGPDKDEAESEIIVAKNRRGPKAIVKVAYFEEQYRFANLAREDA